MDILLFVAVDGLQHIAVVPTRVQHIHALVQVLCMDVLRIALQLCGLAVPLDLRHATAKHVIHHI